MQGESGLNDAYEAEDFNYNYTYRPSFGNTNAGARNDFPGVNTEIEFRASENCPENFLIFDQTDSRSRIMYNPAFTQNCNHQGLNAPPAQFQGSYRVHQEKDNEGKSSSFNEDPKEIDALLGLEDDEEEEDDGDDDAVSTGRTPCSYKCNSPDSICSTGGSTHGKQKIARAEDSASAGTKSEGKTARVKKMVKALRGIVPGGQQMDTPAILDEAVRYLKSLKVEAKKLGLKEQKALDEMTVQE